MQCPFCGTEMLFGYLNCGAAIWSERKHKLSLLPNGRERYALQLETPMVSPNHVESFCCPSCQRIILDSSPYPSHLKEP